MYVREYLFGIARGLMKIAAIWSALNDLCSGYSGTGIGRVPHSNPSRVMLTCVRFAIVAKPRYSAAITAGEMAAGPIQSSGSMKTTATVHRTQRTMHVSATGMMVL